jgi:hypothetical protein
MELLKHLSVSEKHCEAQSCYQLKSKLNLLEELLIFYDNLLEKQDKDKINLKLHEFAIMLIHVKIFKTINCNTGLLKRGHYNEFQSLLRDVYELIFLSQYIVKNPGEAERWLDGEQINHGPVANSLKIPNDVKKIYGSLCDYTHPNMKGVAKNWTKPTKYGDMHFYLISIFQRKISKNLIIMQIYFTFMAINLFFNCFKVYQNFDINDEKQLNRLKKKLPKLEDSWAKFCCNFK